MKKFPSIYFYGRVFYENKDDIKVFVSCISAVRTFSASACISCVPAESWSKTCSGSSDRDLCGIMYGRRIPGGKKDTTG